MIDTACSKRCGFVALIGEPNAGKSTLMNRLVGAKVSIVTHKVQTTRARIRGITIKDQSQIIFVDTPGLFKTKRRLDRAMVASAWSGAEDADQILLLVEAHRGITPGLEVILEELRSRAQTESGKKIIHLAINKIDRSSFEALLKLSEALNHAFPFEKTFLISAETGSGVQDLTDEFAQSLPHGPWLYDADQIADLPLRMLAAEITREKCMFRYHQELPYQMTVETEKWDDKKDGSVRIEQCIYVMRDGHKGIILGPKGATIKAVSIAARKDLEEALERRVHLFLRLKVRPNWMGEADRYRQMGLDFSDSRA